MDGYVLSPRSGGTWHTVWPIPPKVGSWQLRARVPSRPLACAWQRPTPQCLHHPHWQEQPWMKMPVVWHWHLPTIYRQPSQDSHRFKVVEDLGEVSMEGGILEEFLRNTATTECQLAHAHFIERDRCWCSKTLKEFTDDVHWKVVAAQRCGDSFKAKTSKWHIFTRELPNVKSLKVFLESIPGFLFFDD